MPIKKNFGFYPYNRGFGDGDIEIEVLPDLQQQLDRVLSENRTHDGWFYPPLDSLSPVRNSYSAALKPSSSPEVPTTRFTLPSTHSLVHKTSDNGEQVNFLIVSLGFILGMRFSPEPWGHFYRTPVEDNKLSDLHVSFREAGGCLARFDNFFVNSTPEMRALAWSAINSFQMAQCYTHQFEEFLLQYITLDTIYRAFFQKGWVGYVRHGARPRAICEHLRIELPDWAVTDSRGASQISEVRNNLFHEGVVDGGPMGFGIIRPTEMPLAMQALNMRAILYLLGVDEPYVHSVVTSMQTHGLK